MKRHNKKVLSEGIQKKLPIFHQSWWLDIVSPCQWEYSIYTDNNIIIGILPILIKNRCCFKFSGMPLYTPFLGPVFLNENNKKELHILENVVNNFPNNVLLKQNMLLGKDTVSNLSNLKIKSFIRWTYKISTDLPIQTLWSNLSSTRKRRINKGKNVYEIKINSDIDNFIELQKFTFLRQEIDPPQSLAILRKLINKSLEKESGIIFSASHREDEESYKAAGFFVWDQCTMYYLAGGHDSSDKGEAMSLVLWNAILLAKEKQLVFDFEGSMVPSIEKYFKSFGSEKVEYSQVVFSKSSFLRFLYKLKHSF